MEGQHPWERRIEDLERRNADLERRLEQLECGLAEPRFWERLRAFFQPKPEVVAEESKTPQP
jgi:hypothetical protein